MAQRDTPFHAPWTDALQHRPDPNRVTELQVSPTSPAAGGRVSAATQQPSAAAAPSPELLPPTSDHPPGSEPSYYDISLLQAPVWKWQIANYFFFGGLSAGAYLLARMAAHFGGLRAHRTERAGTWIAFVTVLPCPLLLIDDLGDPKRFHHMLRVFKPSSPMNLGTFMLTGYSGMVTAALLRQLVTGRTGTPAESGGTAGAPAKAWLLVHDAAGLPLAIVVAGYTGVLLSCTANPLWCKNAWLGPMFSASAISTGAEAIQLALDCRPSEDTNGSGGMLQKIDTAAHVVEAGCLAGFTRSAGDKAAPLHHGSMRRVHRFAVGALVASEVIKHLPVAPRWRRPVRMLAAAAGLAAGFSMRWAMVHGGHEAANDPHLAREVSRAEPSIEKPFSSLQE